MVTNPQHGTEIENKCLENYDDQILLHIQVHESQVYKLAWLNSHELVTCDLSYIKPVKSLPSVFEGQ